MLGSRCHCPCMLNVPNANPEKPLTLTCEQLYRRADLSRLAFATTRDLDTLPGLLGQRRAQRAIQVGTNIGGAGFNIFATGASGARLFPMVKGILAESSGTPPTFQDWVYVNNFGLPHQPTAIALPPGRAPSLQASLRKLIENLRVTLPALFESPGDVRQRPHWHLAIAVLANDEGVHAA